MLEEHHCRYTIIVLRIIIHHAYDAQSQQWETITTVVPSLWAGIIIYYYHLPTLPINCHNGNYHIPIQILGGVWMFDDIKPLTDPSSVGGTTYILVEVWEEHQTI